jgi:hypothetical protein
MRNLFLVLLLLVAAVTALGYYRGWFSPAMTYDSETGRQGIKVEVDRTKITGDIDKAKQKIGGAGSQAEDKQQGQQP